MGHCDDVRMDKRNVAGQYVMIEGKRLKYIDEWSIPQGNGVYENANVEMVMVEGAKKAKRNKMKCQKE